MTSFQKLCQLTYKDQAIWFLNGFWGDGVDGKVGNQVWKYIEKFVELDKLSSEKKGEAGNELDQFWSAKYIEDMDSAITAQQRKEALRLIDQDNNGKMSAIEYLVWKYKKTPSECETAPQGDNSAAIAAAQAKLDKVMSQLTECETALANQKQAKADNEKAQAECDRQEVALQQAEKEQEEAVAELKRQEEEYAGKIKVLEDKIADPATSGMKKARANNELAQLKAEDPLPLRRAKITAEAALRKVKKQQKAVKVAKEELAVAAQALLKAIADLEQSYVELEKNMAVAREELEKVKSRPGGGKGAIFWMERQMFEADRYLPSSKQKYNHSKDFEFTG